MSCRGNPLTIYKRVNFKNILDDILGYSIEKVNVVPTPTLLSTCSFPPIRFTKLALIGKPILAAILKFKQNSYTYVSNLINLQYYYFL